jgi:hypothetical protein
MSADTMLKIDNQLWEEQLPPALDEIQYTDVKTPFQLENAKVDLRRHFLKLMAKTLRLHHGRKSP